MPFAIFNTKIHALLNHHPIPLRTEGAAATAMLATDEYIRSFFKRSIEIRSHRLAQLSEKT